jgi:hypothetical protein
MPTIIKIKMFHLMQEHKVGWNLEQFHTKASAWMSTARGYRKYRHCNQSGEPAYNKKVSEIWPGCFGGFKPAPATPAACTTSAPAVRPPAVLILLGVRCDGLPVANCFRVGHACLPKDSAGPAKAARDGDYCARSIIA